MKENLITVIGQGYIGLPTSLVFAERGFRVQGYDINQNLISLIKSGKLPFEEKGLSKIFNKVFKKKYFPTHHVSYSDIYIVCVPTPFKPGKIKAPDMSYVFNAIDKIIPFLKSGNTIILESTSPIGSVEILKNYILKKNKKLRNLKFAYSPERVLPGNIIYEMKNLDRIVGGMDKASSQHVTRLYKSITKGRVYSTDAKTAEMSKLTENSYRDVAIAFANEIDLICKKKKIDTKELIKLANLHPRVNILKPSIGVGGHCIPVDPWFLIYSNERITNLIKMGRKINVEKTKTILRNIFLTIKSMNKKKPIIGILGLTYKENVDDLRESPALEIAKNISRKFSVICSDPNLKKKKINNIKLFDYNFIIKKSDLVFKLVNHKEFGKIKNKKIINLI